MYGSEHKIKMKIAKMKMHGMIRLDRIRNEFIRKTLGVMKLS